LIAQAYSPEQVGEINNAFAPPTANNIRRTTPIQHESFYRSSGVCRGFKAVDQTDISTMPLAQLRTELNKQLAGKYQTPIGGGFTPEGDIIQKQFTLPKSK